MPTTLDHMLSVLRAFAGRMLPGRRDRGPIDSLPGLIAFAHTRAAFVAQTSLYGYLKTRMGSRYVSMFQDDVFVASINTAKWPIFASCLADLTIFSCALVADETGLERDQAVAMAKYCYAQAIAQTFDATAPPDAAGIALHAFAQRASLADWAAASEGETAFGRSPQDLVVHAPVVDTFKALDAEIVRNSMRFRWRAVRSDLRSRLNAAAIADHWRGQDRAAAEA